ncbi:MAG TPA: hypothetical protein VGD64_00605, partial [Acidisarcina sp.]
PAAQAGQQGPTLLVSGNERTCSYTATLNPKQTWSPDLVSFSIADKEPANNANNKCEKPPDNTVYASRDGIYNPALRATLTVKEFRRLGPLNWLHIGNQLVVVEIHPAEATP